MSWYWAREGDREKRLAEIVHLARVPSSRAVPRRLTRAAGVLDAGVDRAANSGGRVLQNAARRDENARTPCRSPTAPPRARLRCTVFVAARASISTTEDVQPRDRSEVQSAADGVMFAGGCAWRWRFRLSARVNWRGLLTIRAARWTLAPASRALAGTVVFFAFFMAHREAVETIIQCLRGYRAEQRHAAAAVPRARGAQAHLRGCAGAPRAQPPRRRRRVQAEFKEQRRGRKKPGASGKATAVAWQRHRISVVRSSV